MRELTDVEAAFLAGIYEGEGSLVRHNSGWTIKVDMTDEDTVRRVHELTGTGTVRPDGPRPGRKPTYRWAASRRDDIRALGLAMRPWLGARRTARIDEFLAWYDATASSVRASPSRTRGQTITDTCPKHGEGPHYIAERRRCVRCVHESYVRRRARQ